MNGPARFGMALEYVADLEAARRFYVEVMGLKVAQEQRNFVQFDHFAISSTEGFGELREREVYWLVDDAEAAFARMSSQRVEVMTGLEQLPFGKVFSIRGPAGEPCYLLELAKNPPSHTV